MAPPSLLVRSYGAFRAVGLLEQDSWLLSAKSERSRELHKAQVKQSRHDWACWSTRCNRQRLSPEPIWLSWADVHLHDIAIRAGALRCVWPANGVRRQL